jgi:uncharacterized protein YegP (UPF0339 family)
MKPRVQMKRGRTGQIRFLVVGRNGEVLASSENYKSPVSARKGIAALIAACTDPELVVDHLPGDLHVPPPAVEPVDVPATEPEPATEPAPSPEPKTGDVP